MIFGVPEARCEPQEWGSTRSRVRRGHGTRTLRCLSLPPAGPTPQPYGVLQAASAPRPAPTPPALQGGEPVGLVSHVLPIGTLMGTGHASHMPPSGTVLLRDTPMSWAPPQAMGQPQRGVGLRLGQVGQGWNDVSCQHIPA